MHRRTATRRIVTDGRLLGQIDDLRETLRMAKMAERFSTQGLADQSPRLEQELIELSHKAADESLTITVQALPAEEFDDIARRHPPSAEQLERWREHARVSPLAEMPEWNDRTMAPDLLAACLVEPKFTDEWWRELSKGIQIQLWNLALSVQVQGADLPFFNAATATTNGGGDKSTIAASEEFPSQSS